MDYNRSNPVLWVRLLDLEKELISMSKQYKHFYYIWEDVSMEWKEVQHADYLAYKKEHRDAPRKNVPDYPNYFHFIG